MKFYAHLVEVESLIIELDQMDLSPKEKKHLAQLLDATIHHTVLDAILSHLSDKDKKEFMEYIAKENNEKIWDFLNSRVDHIEDKIVDAAKDLKEKLHQDLKHAHTLKKGNS